MAEIDPKIIDEFNASLAAGTMTQNTYNSSMGVMALQAKKAAEKSAIFAQSLDRATVNNEGVIKQATKLKQSLEEDIKSLRRHAVDSQDLADKINELKNSVARDINNPALAKSVANQIDSLNRSAGASESFSKILQAVGPTFAALGSGIGKLASDYQSHGKGIGLATTVFETAVSAGGAAAKGLSGPVSAAGSALMGLPHPVAKVVGGLGILAGGLLQGAAALSEVAKKALPFLKQELEANIASFQSLSSSGALFGDGLTGMIKAAGEAGLTVTQFDGVVKTNSESLAQSGLGITDASKKMGAALKAGGDPMKKELLNLGFSIEAQAGLVADTMARMRQTGGPLQASNAEVAEQTKKYADNLRLISSITGEDAKAKYKAAQDSANELAFQQKLAGMDEKQRSSIIDSMANMDAATKKAVMETVIFGQAVTTESAGLMAQIPAFAQRVIESAAAIADGTASAKKQQDINAATQADIAKQAQAATGLAQAAFLGVGGAADTLGKALSALNVANSRQTKEATESARAELEKQKQTEDERTSAMNDVIIATQMMALEIQSAILDSGVMTGFAKSVDTVTRGLLGVIEAFRGEFNKDRTATTNIPGSLASRGGTITSGNIARDLQGPQQEVEKFGAMPARAKTPTELLKENGLTTRDVVGVKGNVITLKDGRRIDTTKGGFVNEQGEAVAPTAPTTQTPTPPEGQTPDTAPVVPATPGTPRSEVPASPGQNRTARGRIRESLGAQIPAGPTVTEEQRAATAQRTAAVVAEAPGNLERVSADAQTSVQQTEKTVKIMEHIAQLMQAQVELAESNQRTMEQIERHTQQTAVSM
jgi:hypothetical protein